MDDAAVYDARLELLDFVVEVFWDVPDESFLSNLLGDGLQLPDAEVNESLDEGFDLLRQFVADNEGRDPAAVRDELAREYTRVFVGPRPPVLAHETYYREDTDFIGEGLARVEASYGAAGWKPPEEYGEENDFIAVELAFLRYLVERQYHGAEEAFGYERVFLDEHLSAWHEAFVDDVLDETEEPLFRAAALVFDGLVEFEDELVAQMVS
ncbi:molecular chaperone [Haloprofundus sp. MHR1]|uniref:TorD/DmsD family molecular chaperone n=1 Tax=Haloprofundus sp. MHR1 TaxID=2572921 RepID=UPI0010BEFCFC|nr:molecular chaperone TorD family protein [Haloprofundus sp. MHR1]QCJ46030.1 molecular chaperone TorD [Haloprofundus sp. MHR1]